MRAPKVAGALVALATAFAALVAAALPAAAHPTDELLQLVYVTPGSASLTIEVELVPGSDVATSFFDAIDTDRDGVLSSTEIAAFLDLVGRDVHASLDGQALALRVASFDVPDEAVLRGGGTPIVLCLVAPVGAPTGTRVVQVEDRFAPMRTTVQAGVTLDDARSVALGAITHADGGAVMTVEVRGASPGAPPSGGARGGSTTTSTWAIGALLGAAVLAVAATFARRARPARRDEVGAGAAA